ncbi:MAG: adenylate/guanylate cyclase domain-containing protein [Prolixibacteraceae bacterium]|nr:adenylate/guanylate cyclase domain-containing protein [Prolixibacteraceae bacterium]MBN2775600.1 adenylate/guanylate cyclase domain-containing protein [Prolixibacteraceae bacterium]
MTRLNKSTILPAIEKFLFVTIFWIALMYIYFFFTWWSFQEYLPHDLYGGYIFSPLMNVEILGQGIMFGILYSVVEYIVGKTKIRKKSFGAIILIKSLFYFFAIILSMGFVVAIYIVFDLIPVDSMIEFLNETPALLNISLVLYVILAIVFLNLVSQVSRKFGRGVFLHMIIGTYHKPRKERRIFMFLDLNNSTGLAEELGHYDYSRFIQSCIHDLNELILRFKAQVYQYVGDEIVLTWKADKGFENCNCIEIFYAYENRLKKNERIYMSKFGNFPMFKAGLDEGIITVTEVGDIKREIAYHGDVLNTASRLEKMCNKLNQKILISDRLSKHLPDNHKFQKKLIGEILLKGKGKKEKVYGIEKI